MKKLLIALIIMLGPLNIVNAAEWANVEYIPGVDGSDITIAIDISTANISAGNGMKTTWRRTHFKIPGTTMSNLVIFTNETIDCKRKMWKATYLESYDHNVFKDKKTEGFPWNFFDLTNKRDVTIYRIFCQ